MSWQMFEVRREYGFMKGLLGLWVFSAAVSALASPNEKSSKFYAWIYRFSHLLAENLDRLQITASLPGDKEVLK